MAPRTNFTITLRNMFGRSDICFVAQRWHLQWHFKLPRGLYCIAPVLARWSENIFGCCVIAPSGIVFSNCPFVLIAFRKFSELSEDAWVAFLSHLAYRQHDQRELQREYLQNSRADLGDALLRDLRGGLPQGGAGVRAGPGARGFALVRSEPAWLPDGRAKVSLSLSLSLYTYIYIYTYIIHIFIVIWNS